MSFPICGLSSSVRLALVARDSTSDVRNTADSNLGQKRAVRLGLEYWREEPETITV